MAEIELTMPNYDIKELQIVQSNKFIRSKKSDLTITESKFVRFVLSQISRDEDIGRTYTISLNRLIEELNLDRSNAYKEFLTMASNLLKQTIYIDKGTKDKNGNPNYRLVTWFTSFQYDDGEITVRISEDIRQFLICSRDFTRYYLSETLALSTDNCIKLYELLWSWSAKTNKNPNICYKGKKLADNEVMYEIDFLRRYFNCEDKYPAVKDFRKRIIDANLEQIRKKLCLDVTYRTVKEGQRTVALIFQIGRSFQ